MTMNVRSRLHPTQVYRLYSKVRFVKFGTEPGTKIRIRQTRAFILDKKRIKNKSGFLSTTRTYLRSKTHVYLQPVFHRANTRLSSLFIYVLFCHLVDVIGRFKEPGGDVLWKHTYCAIFQIMQLSDWRAHAALHHRKDSIMFHFAVARSLHSA